MSLFDSYSLVILVDYSSVSVQNVSVLSSYLYPRAIPLMIARSRGLFGVIRVSLSEHIGNFIANKKFDLFLFVVLNSHSDSQFDYRINSPWIELKNYSQNSSITTHTPFPVLLIKAVTSLNGNVSIDSIKDFLNEAKILIQKLNADDDGNVQFENFEEANRYAYLTLKSNTENITDALSQLFNHATSNENVWKKIIF